MESINSIKKFGISSGIFVYRKGSTADFFPCQSSIIIHCVFGRSEMQYIKKNVLNFKYGAEIILP
jgi:hypothetical protein